jgi:hypothetical protein
VKAVVARSLARAGLGAVTLTLARRLYLRWGSTPDELAATLPGDELMPRASITATRAISVAAAADHVWPWIAQIGQGRGGFYSYDFLENLVGCGIHSADRIVAAWQAPAVGSEFLLHPEVALRVAELHPGSALVLEGGVAMGPIPPPYDFSWAFVVREGANRSTRLVVRERYRYTRRWSALLVEPVQVISFVMSERMLRGIRLRSQRAIAAEVERESRPVG